MDSKRTQVRGGFAAVALLALASAGCADRPVDLDQGWSPAQLKFWYDAGQGSRLIPESWLAALEQPDGAGAFLNPHYMEGFRFQTRDGPLPVGFVRDVQDDGAFTTTRLRWKPGQTATEPWIGLTCATCHSSELRYGRHTMQVEGGATLVDFQGFIEALNAALVRTRDDPKAFDRFADKVLGAQASAADRSALKAAFATYVGNQAKSATMNQAHVRYGYGRNDAFGYIYNKTSLVYSPDAPTANPPDAPVSYPFLWNIPQQIAVQWNGMATNKPPPAEAHGQGVDQGALARNAGEVTGVFGDVSIQGGPGGLTYASSVDLGHLAALEKQLEALRPPRWPRDLFPVDQKLADEGRGLYASRCASCHAELPRSDLMSRTRQDGSPLERIIPLAPPAGSGPTIATDPVMACNAVTLMAATGLVAGAPLGPTARMPPQAPVALMLVNLVGNVLRAKAPGAPPEPPAVAPAAVVWPSSVGLTDRAGSTVVALTGPCAQHAGLTGGKDLGYKARPLTGVWATAPFLHNGSVPTLYDLLLPAEKRPATFNLGTREFDPKRVGLVTKPGHGNDFVFRTVAPGGAPIAGNSNQGHDYDNASLTDRQRKALVEYLKVVGEETPTAKP